MGRRRGRHRPVLTESTGTAALLSERGGPTNRELKLHDRAMTPTGEYVTRVAPMPWLPLDPQRPGRQTESVLGGEPAVGLVRLPDVKLFCHYLRPPGSVQPCVCRRVLARDNQRNADNGMPLGKRRSKSSCCHTNANRAKGFIELTVPATIQ